MCDMCDENDGELQSCQDCGCLICFDHDSGDGIIRRAYVTSSGDLFCRSCGRQYDEEDDDMEGFGG